MAGSDALEAGFGFVVGYGVALGVGEGTVVQGGEYCEAEQES